MTFRPSGKGDMKKNILLTSVAATLTAIAVYLAKAQPFPSGGGPYFSGAAANSSQPGLMTTNQYTYLLQSVENRNSQWRFSPPFGCEPWFWKGANMYETDYWTLATIYNTNSMSGQYIDITGGWATTTNAAGMLIEDPVKFPHGLAFTVNVIHTNNQLAMIYCEPTPIAANGTIGLSYQFDVNASNFVWLGIDAVRMDYSQENVATAGHNQRYVGYNQLMSSSLQNYAGHPIPLGGNGWDTNQLVLGPGSQNYFQTRGLGDLVTSDPNTLGGYWKQLYAMWYANMPYASQGGPGHWMSIDYLPNNLGPGYAILYAFLATPRFLSLPQSRSMNALANAVMTNQDIINVNLDPHIGIIVRSNADGSMVGRKMMNDGSRFMAFFNPSTNANVTLDFQASDAGYTPGTLMDVKDVWFQTNAYSISSMTSTVPFLTNSGFIVVQTQVLPKAVTNRLADIRANIWDISSGMTRLTYSSFSPTPYFIQDGASCAGNVANNILVSLPEWVTNVSGYMYMQCADASNPQAWTNTFDGYWYTFSSSGRLTSSSQIYGGTAPTTVTVATNNGLNYVTWTNLALANTNCPKALSITLGASTNTTTRYFLGPMRLLFN